MNIKERKLDLLNIIEGVDISPSMYKNAVEKYNNIAKYLETHGLRANIYPQGSFALGTVTRPYSKSDDKAYDLDFVCQVEAIRGEVSPKALRDKIQTILESSELYGGKLVINDECFTIEYAEIGTYGFSIDIVPAVDETSEKKTDLMKKSEIPSLVETSIAIPKSCQQNVYKWITNNPKGYCKWFSDINEKFAVYSNDEFRRYLYSRNMGVFRSVEEIPEELNRSSLQRVVQILKYHRDVYFSNIPDGEDIKPISAIINTVVAKVSFMADPRCSVFELLGFVLEELNIYSERVSLSEDVFKQQFGDRDIIQKVEGNWKIKNPANPEDNLADKWNNDPKIPRYFFKWLSSAKLQLIDALELSDEDFRASAEAAFGRNNIQRTWGEKYYHTAPKPISSDTKVKPWRGN